MDADGGLNLDKLLAAFQDFFRRHSEHWKNRFLYEEAWPQILLQAYLHRVVNGGGRIEREYGLGRGRVDLLIMWPQDGRRREYAVECKVVRAGDGLENTISRGVEQTAGYMARCAAEGGASGGHRPARGPELGREGVPPAAAVRGRHAGGGVGHVTQPCRRAGPFVVGAPRTDSRLSTCSPISGPLGRCRASREIGGRDPRSRPPMRFHRVPATGISRTARRRPGRRRGSDLRPCRRTSARACPRTSRSCRMLPCESVMMLWAP